MDSAVQSTNLGFDPMHLAFSSVSVNTSHFLTVIGTILGRIRRAELSLSSRLEEEGIRADLVARDRRVATLGGNVTRLCGHLLARQRVGALRI